jgi:predicted nucleic-acid-binding Zn-ribbon protein
MKTNSSLKKGKNYQIEVVCTNCNYGNGQVEHRRVEFGKKFERETCPRCGCDNIVNAELLNL